MIKEELENRAREYLAEHSEYSEVFGQTFVAVDTLTAMVDFAEPKEKQIEIDAEQIRALQKQNGELTDELTKKSDTNHQLVEQLANLEAENADLKCECRRCVYSDTFCIVSDYGKDKNGTCDHFKDIFEELTLTNNECKDMREELKQRIRENQKLCEQNGELTDELKDLRESIKDYSTGCYENGLRNGKRKLESQIEKMKSALIDIKSNTDDVNIEWQIKYLFDELGIKEK